MFVKYKEKEENRHNKGKCQSRKKSVITGRQAAPKQPTLAISENLLMCKKY